MRHLVHVLVSIAMWCLFGYYWYVVLGRELGPGTVRAMETLGVVIVVGLVVTGLWIGHNLRVARKFEGRRQGFRESADATLERDTIGRNVERPDLAELRAARVVEIDADEKSKTYRVADAKEAP